MFLRNEKSYHLIISVIAFLLAALKSLSLLFHRSINYELHEKHYFLQVGQICLQGKQKQFVFLVNS